RVRRRGRERLAENGCRVGRWLRDPIRRDERKADRLDANLGEALLVLRRAATDAWLPRGPPGRPTRRPSQRPRHGSAGRLDHTPCPCCQSPCDRTPVLFAVSRFLTET